MGQDTGTVITTVVTDEQIATLKATAQLDTHPAVALVEQVDLDYPDPEAYQMADSLFGHIKFARRKVEERFDPIIGPIRKGLDKLYALRREADHPLDQAERDLKDKMAAYKTEERLVLAEVKQIEEDKERALQAESRRRAAEETQLRLESERRQEEVRRDTSEENRRKAEALAAESKARAEAAEQASRQADQALEVQVMTAAIPAPVRAYGTTVRTVRRWRVPDIEPVLKAVVAGRVPVGVLMIDKEWVDRYYKSDKGTVEGWEGFEGYEDSSIVGRSR